MDHGQSSTDSASGAEDGGTTVEIKIRTLNAQSYTLRVEKNTPVPALKDRIASVAGIPVENQRLIHGGKVLKDDQILSAYNVEDGHTLHLVTRQPPPPPVSSGQDQAGSGAHGSDMFIVSPRNRSGHVSHSLLMGTINIPDTGEGGMPDLNRIISAVLNSVGIGNAVPSAQAGTGTGGTVTVGVLPTRPAQAAGSEGQARPGDTDSRVQTGPSGFDNGVPRELEATLQIDALYGSPPPGVLDGTGLNAHPPFRIIQQPMVVPDALTTMSQYLDRLEQSFSVAEGGTGNTTGGTSVNEAADQPESTSGQTLGSHTVQAVTANAPSAVPEGSRSTSSLPSPTPTSDGPESGVSSGPPAPARRSPTPQALGSIVQRVQTLLSGQAGSALSRLAAQLENEPSLLDPAGRADVQATAIRDGHMMQNLGALLLELGRTTLTLRMGQSPTESVVNAGPAVFISPSGPNPMMVQSVPLQTGVALGTLPVGASQPSGGIVGPALGPRSINIHIHTSDLRLPSGAPSSPTPSSSQRPPRPVAGATSGAPALTVRQATERTDAANVENGLRQILVRGDLANAAQQGGGEANPQAATATAVQGAIMTFNEDGAVRVVPVRARPAATGRGGTSAGNVSNDVNPTTLLARFQQQLESLQRRSTPHSSAPGSSAAGTNSSSQETSASVPPTSMPPIRAQVHVQSWAPTFMQDTGFSQPLVYTPATGEILLQPRNQAQATTVSHQAGLNSGAPSQVSSEPVPATASSGEQVDPHRRNLPEVGRTVAAGPGVSQQEVHEFAHSLGPLLNQIVAAFRPPRLPNDGAQNEQGNGQSSVDQSRGAPEMVGSRATTTSSAEPRPNNPQPVEGGRQSQASDQRPPETSADIQTGDKMLVRSSSEDDSRLRLSIPVEHGSVERSAVVSMDTGERSPVTSTDVAQSSGQGENKRSSPPVGLGQGGLTPLPPRGRRRSNVQQRHGPSVSSGPERQQSAPSGDPTTPAARNFLESFVSSVDRENDASEGSSTEESLEQLTQGLLPLLGNLSNVVTGQTGGDSNLGDIMGQLMSRTSEGNAAQAPFPSSMLRGMMGQVVQSPIMGNILQQIMSGPRGEEAQSPGQAPAGISGEGALDFTGVVQQMLPVISRMFGGSQTPSLGQQGPTAVDDLRQNEGSAAREIPGQSSDTGRWREALSEEEAAQWSETITADVEQQQSESPQRPFSDTYVRGSAVAKRQKTELEGTAQKLENGGASEDVLRSVAENVAEQFVGTNGAAHGEGVQLAEHVVGTEGLPEAYMAVLFHDLAARVAADPDFGDGSRFPNAARVFQQPKATKEADGG